MSNFLLVGMSDALTSYLTCRLRSPFPMVYKCGLSASDRKITNPECRYVPYGKLSDVMPYLSRRAIENKSVLMGSDGAVEERRIAMSAIRRVIWS